MTVGHQVRARQSLQMPGNPGALHLLGMVKVQTGEYREAVRLIGCSIESGGPNPARLNDLASALRAAGEPEAAMHRYREALALRDDLVPAWLGLADTPNAFVTVAVALVVLVVGNMALPGKPGYLNRKGAEAG